MDLEKLHEGLLSAVSLSNTRAVLRVVATYQPAGGSGSKVFPPTYPPQNGAPPYVIEPRVVDGQERRAVQLDSTPSQANRAEEALLRAHRAGRVRVPLLQIEHTGAAPVVLTSLEFPHRYADAYLRDSVLDGVKFDQSTLGKALLAATNADASVLYAQDPGSLVYGAWNSHRKGRQQKFPRVYASEVVRLGPAAGCPQRRPDGPAEPDRRAQGRGRQLGVRARWRRRPRARSSARSGTATSPRTPPPTAA